MAFEQRGYAVAGGVADEQTREPSHGGKRQSFCDELPHDPGSASSQREPQADLALPCSRFREQQVRDIGAGDQQHQTRKRQNNKQHSTVVICDVVHSRGRLA